MGFTSPNGGCPIGGSPIGVSPIDPSVQMGVVQLGVVQLGVVQLGIVQMGVDLATDITTIWGELLEQTSCCVLKIGDSINWRNI